MTVLLDKRQYSVLDGQVAPIALLHIHERLPLDEDILHRGAAYLAERFEDWEQEPDLWLGKNLYKPYDVVRSAILSALILYCSKFGRTL